MIFATQQLAYEPDDDDPCAADDSTATMQKLSAMHEAITSRRYNCACFFEARAARMLDRRVCVGPRAICSGHESILGARSRAERSPSVSPPVQASRLCEACATTLV